MNKRVWVVVTVVVAVLVLLFIASCVLCQKEVGIINTFGERSNDTFIINRTNHLGNTSIEKEINASYKRGFPYFFYNDRIAKNRIVEESDYITNEFLDAITNENNYLEFPGEVISQLGYYFLVKKDDGNYIYEVDEQDYKTTISKYVKTPCNRLVCINDYLCCATPNNDMIYMYPGLDLRSTPKILDFKKPSFISGPEEQSISYELYVFDGQFLTHYNDDGSVDGKVELGNIPVNDKMLVFGSFSICYSNEILFYDGSNAWGISFKDKKVLWKKQIDIIGQGTDRVGCYFAPTKQGIMAISSSTGETKLIVDGDGWKLTDSVNDNLNNSFSSGNAILFLRQLGNNRYEPVLLLVTEGKAKVVTCEPFEGEYRGYFFLQDARISLEKSVFNFVFLTSNRVYQYSIKRPFKIVFK